MVQRAPKDAISESDGGPAPPFKHLKDIFSEGLHKNPKAPAVISTYQHPTHLIKLTTSLTKSANEKHACLEWSYEDLDGASSKVASGLMQHGLLLHSSLVTFVWDSLDWALLFWVAAKLSLTFVSLDVRLLKRPEETHYVLDLVHRNCSLGLIAVADAGIAEALDALDLDSVKSAKKLTTHSLSNNDRDGWTDLVALSQNTTDNTNAPLPPPNPDPNHPAALIFTSGTTGRPKACPHNALNLSTASHAYVLARRLHTSTRFLVQSANFRVICMNTSTAVWRAGGCIVFASPESSVPATLRTVNPFRCTHTLCMPSRVHELVRHPDFAAFRPKTLQVLSMAGDVMDDRFLAFAREALGAGVVLNVYGMTEAPNCIGRLPGEEFKSRNGIPGAGKALPGTKVRICKPGTRLLAPVLEVGELRLGGLESPVIHGYFEGLGSEAFYEDDDGEKWFVTGDQALMDEEGVVYILGRFKNVIKRGGLGLSPAVIEGSIRKVEGIVEVQVVGVRDEVYGALPVAVVKCSREGVSHFLVKEKVESELGREHVPVHIFDLRELRLDDFPVSPAGKVQKGLLIELVKKSVDALKKGEADSIGCSTST